MRILITLYTTAWGGAEESVLDLASELSIKGIDTTVIWISNYKSKNKFPITNNFRCIRLCLSQKIYSLLASPLIAILCVWFRIELVNLNWRFVKEESRFLKLLKIKSVATVRAILFDKDNCDEFCDTNAVIGVSKAVTRRMKKIGYNRPLFTIYNGIKVNHLIRYPVQDYSSSKILSIGRLVAWKRIDWSIRAVSELRKKNLPLTLDIYGEGIEYKNLDKLIIELKASSFIKLKGYISNNSDKLKKYGIFLIPSFKEPFGKTIVENVIRERVVVGSKSGGIPELLPKYPLLFQYTNYFDYVKKIELAYRHFFKYQRIIQGYKNCFESKYNISRVANDYIRVYNRI